MSTLLLGTTDWQRHMTPPDGPDEAQAYEAQRNRLVESLQERGELTEVIYEAEAVLAKLLGEGKTELAGKVLQAVFDDYIECCLNRWHNPGAARCADALAAATKALADNAPPTYSLADARPGLAAAAAGLMSLGVRA